MFGGSRCERESERERCQMPPPRPLRMLACLSLPPSLLLAHRGLCSLLPLSPSQAAYLRANASRFAPFVPMEDDDGEAGGLEAYCKRVEGTAMWGGHLELQALAGALQLPVVVYEAAADNFVAKEDGCEPDGEPIELSYHRHMYSLGEHYNSVVKK
jgi:OTU domain-containing protein 6